ncbi:MAG: hypothetical protein ACKV2U_33485 [Bryobacteraceae bacterium]
MTTTLTGGRMRLVRHCAEHPYPKWYFGLDLGQRQDYSALAALELTWSAQGRCPVTFEFQFEPRLEIRFLKRFPKGFCYEDLYHLVEECLRVLAPVTTARELIIDAGGPGPPVVDRLRRNLDSGLIVKPIIITGGKGANTLNGGYTGVPRRTVISNFLLLMAAKSLKCKRDLDGFLLLQEELLELAGESTQPAAKASHDDLAIATGLAAWSAARDVPELLPETKDARKRRNSGSMFGSGPLF